MLGAGLKRLEVGADLVFVEEAGDKGLQVSTVRVAGARRGLEREAEEVQHALQESH